MAHPARIETTTFDAGDGITFTVDPAGFPVERCRRCSGQGEIPAYSNVLHGQCFDCHGAGHRYPKHPGGDLAREWYGRREARVVHPRDMRAGMLVRPCVRRRGDWRLLAADPAGPREQTYPNGLTLTHVDLVFTDGTTESPMVHGGDWETIPVDDAAQRERLAAAAREKWTARLKRSAAARARRTPVGSLAGRVGEPNNPGVVAEVGELPDWMC